MNKMLTWSTFVLLVLNMLTSFLILPTDNVKADDPPGFDGEAYLYHYAPPSSFGMSSFKSVNWSWFKQKFQSHFYKDAMYKRYSYSSWENGNSYVGIEKSWNSSGFWKINITLDIPVDLYEVNISFGCDLPVLQYINRSGYEVWLNYTANNTEVYQVMFNWSDLASIPGLSITKHKEDGIYYISLHKNNVPSGFYVFDPTFGVTDLTGYGSATAPANYIIGIHSQSPASSGTLDNITVYCTKYTANCYVKCALYRDSDEVLIGETEEHFFDVQDWGWKVFNFTGSPSVSAGVEYTICFWAKDNSVYIYRKASTDAASFDNLAYNGFPNPITWDNEEGYDYSYTLYCSYTESGGGNNPPDDASNPNPVNNSVDVTRETPCIDLNVTVTDPDGDSMNVTWWNNSSGSWALFGTNLSVANNSNIIQCNSNMTAYGTTYWWSVNISDGEGGWRNSTFSFTLEDKPIHNPAAGGEGPVNGSVDVTRETPCLPLNVTVTDPDGDTMNITWWSNSSGSWVQFASNTSVANNTNIIQCNSNFTDNCTKYYWSVNISDGEGGWGNFTFHFTLICQPYIAPTFGDTIYPTNESTDVCPCCDALGFNVSANYSINLTVYGREVGHSYWEVWSEYVNVSEGLYAFCLGELQTYISPYVVGKLTTDTAIVAINVWQDVTYDAIVLVGVAGIDLDESTGEFVIPRQGHYTMFFESSFKTTDLNPLGDMIAVRLLRNGVPIDGGYRESVFAVQDELLHPTGYVEMTLDKDDVLKYQWIASDADISLGSIQEWSSDQICFYAYLVKLGNPQFEYDRQYEWYVNTSQFGNSSLYNESDVFVFTTAASPDVCNSGGGGRNNLVPVAIAMIAVAIAFVSPMLFKRRRKYNGKEW